MPRKARALDLRAAIAVPEKTVEVLNITFAEFAPPTAPSPKRTALTCA